MVVKYFLLSLISGIQDHAGLLLTISITFLIAYYTGRSSRIAQKQMEETNPAISKIERYTDKEVKIFVINRKPNPIEIKNVSIKKHSIYIFARKQKLKFRCDTIEKIDYKLGKRWLSDMPMIEKFGYIYLSTPIINKHCSYKIIIETTEGTYKYIRKFPVE